jgi:hypothetical protein
MVGTFRVGINVDINQVLGDRSLADQANQSQRSNNLAASLAEAASGGGFSLQTRQLRRSRQEPGKNRRTALEVDPVRKRYKNIDQLGSGNGSDWYTFTLDAATQLIAKLRFRGEDTDLLLLGPGVKFRSNNPGTKAEKLREDLAAGQYFVQVQGSRRGETLYKLVLGTRAIAVSPGTVPPDVVPPGTTGNPGDIGNPTTGGSGNTGGTGGTTSPGTPPPDYVGNTFTLSPSEENPLEVQDTLSSSELTPSSPVAGVTVVRPGTGSEFVGGGDVDIYNFTLEQPRYVDLALVNQTVGTGNEQGNLKLELFASTDTSDPLFQSDNPGTNTEELKTPLAAGTYYIRISEPGNMAIPYSLTMNLPVAADNGYPFPTTANYVSGYDQLLTDGFSTVTIDNTQSDSDVFVKLFSLDATEPSPVRVMFIPANGSFTAETIDPGTYDIRYRDLSSGSLFRSESFELEETQEQTSEGTVITSTQLTLTLYRVIDGNTETYPLTEEGFT